MNQKIKIIHDALKALEFDTECDAANSIVFVTCDCMEYAIEYHDDDKQYFVVEHLTGASSTDTWTANDALSVVGRINANKTTLLHEKANNIYKKHCGSAQNN